jgi:hypothetical protein
MNPGDTWEAQYKVYVNNPSRLLNDGQLDGTSIRSGASAEKLGDSLWTDYFVWLEYWPWSRTAWANLWAQTIGDPISAGTGEHYIGPTQDLSLGGPLPLAFSRYYASGLHDDGVVTGTLGVNWMHNFDLRVLNTASWRERVVVYRWGKLVYFGKAWNNPEWESQYISCLIPLSQESTLPTILTRLKDSPNLSPTLGHSRRMMNSQIEQVSIFASKL